MTPDLRSPRWLGVDIDRWKADFEFVQACVERMNGAEFQTWAACTFPLGVLSSGWGDLAFEIREEFRASRPLRIWFSGGPTFSPDLRDQ